MEALDEVRREVWREAYSEAVRLAKEHPRKKGRPRADDAESAMVMAAKAKAEERISDCVADVILKPTKTKLKVVGN